MQLLQLTSERAKIFLCAFGDAEEGKDSEFTKREDS